MRETEGDEMTKVAFVVQRYGLEVNGGSELHCRQVAEHMAQYWDVDVLTTCALDYITWQNEYPPGPTTVNGITVQRFPVDVPRDVAAFNQLSANVLVGGGAGRDAELHWMKAQGPCSSALLAYLQHHHQTYDMFVFFTYLYASTFFGLPLVADRSILVPTAHDEPPIYLEIFRELFCLPKVLIFNTTEEQDFVNQRFGTQDILQEVVGVGIEMPTDARAERFLAQHAQELEERAFILYVGRVDASKGCRQLCSHFMRFREDVPEYPLKLVLLGSQAMEIPPHPDIVALGFVSDQDKDDAMAAAQVVMLPSPYESLSMVALEAWQQGKPVLANGTCAVLRGQCKRSNGGLWYDNYAEFQETLSLLLQEAGLRERLGVSGRSFVQRCYAWTAIEKQYLNLVNSVPREDAEQQVTLSAGTRRSLSLNLEELLSPQLDLPTGESLDSILSYLQKYYVEGSTKEEVENYLKEDFKRFLYTLQLIPKESGKLLEIGANPYFMSLLVKKYTNYDLYCSNYFGESWPAYSTQKLINVDNKSIEFPFYNFNIENDKAPFDSHTFDVILFCEVIEHLILDPVNAVMHIKNVLKPNGYLILTTPNVDRLENVARILAGANIYDPYSGYGVYGRHNREYNRHEIYLLLTHLGFDVETIFTADVHENRAHHFFNIENIKDIIALVQNREYDLGQYIFAKAKNVREENVKKPRWLYRSYPSHLIED
jgi:glycosyltransferase involved in cell wall biosynthesis/SAM-dependent methyltransferase